MEDNEVTEPVADELDIKMYEAGIQEFETRIEIEKCKKAIIDAGRQVNEVDENESYQRKALWAYEHALRMETEWKQEKKPFEWSKSEDKESQFARYEQECKSLQKTLEKYRKFMAENGITLESQEEQAPIEQNTPPEEQAPVEQHEEASYEEQEGDKTQPEETKQEESDEPEQNESDKSETEQEEPVADDLDIKMYEAEIQYWEIRVEIEKCKKAITDAGRQVSEVLKGDTYESRDLEDFEGYVKKNTSRKQAKEKFEWMTPEDKEGEIAKEEQICKRLQEKLEEYRKFMEENGITLESQEEQAPVEPNTQPEEQAPVEQHEEASYEEQEGDKTQPEETEQETPDEPEQNESDESETEQEEPVADDLDREMIAVQIENCNLALEIVELQEVIKKAGLPLEEAKNLKFEDVTSKKGQIEDKRKNLTEMQSKNSTYSNWRNGREKKEQIESAKLGNDNLRFIIKEYTEYILENGISLESQEEQAPVEQNTPTEEQAPVEQHEETGHEEPTEAQTQPEETKKEESDEPEQNEPEESETEQEEPVEKHEETPETPEQGKPENIERGEFSMEKMEEIVFESDLLKKHLERTVNGGIKLVNEKQEELEQLNKDKARHERRIKNDISEDQFSRTEQAKVNVLKRKIKETEDSIKTTKEEIKDKIERFRKSAEKKKTDCKQRIQKSKSRMERVEQEKAALKISMDATQKHRAKIQSEIKRLNAQIENSRNAGETGVAEKYEEKKRKLQNELGPHTTTYRILEEQMKEKMGQIKDILKQNTKLLAEYDEIDIATEELETEVVPKLSEFLEIEPTKGDDDKDKDDDDKGDDDKGDDDKGDDDKGDDDKGDDDKGDDDKGDDDKGDDDKGDDDKGDDDKGDDDKGDDDKGDDDKGDDGKGDDGKGNDGKGDDDKKTPQKIEVKSIKVDVKKGTYTFELKEEHPVYGKEIVVDINDPETMKRWGIDEKEKEIEDHSSTVGIQALDSKEIQEKGIVENEELVDWIVAHVLNKLDNGDITNQMKYVRYLNKSEKQSTTDKMIPIVYDMKDVEKNQRKHMQQIVKVAQKAGKTSMVENQKAGWLSKIGNGLGRGFNALKDVIIRQKGEPEALTEEVAQDKVDELEEELKNLSDNDKIKRLYEIYYKDPKNRPLVSKVVDDLGLNTQWLAYNPEEQKTEKQGLFAKMRERLSRGKKKEKSIDEVDLEKEAQWIRFTKDNDAEKKAAIEKLKAEGKITDEDEEWLLENVGIKETKKEENNELAGNQKAFTELHEEFGRHIKDMRNKGMDNPDIIAAFGEKNLEHLQKLKEMSENNNFSQDYQMQCKVLKAKFKQLYEKAIADRTAGKGKDEKTGIEALSERLSKIQEARSVEGFYKNALEQIDAEELTEEEKKEVKEKFSEEMLRAIETQLQTAESVPGDYSQNFADLCNLIKRKATLMLAAKNEQKAVEAVIGYKVNGGEFEQSTEKLSEKQKQIAILFRENNVNTGMYDARHYPIMKEAIEALVGFGVELQDVYDAMKFSPEVIEILEKGQGTEGR